MIPYNHAFAQQVCVCLNNAHARYTFETQSDGKHEAAVFYLCLPAFGGNAAETPVFLIVYPDRFHAGATDPCRADPHDDDQLTRLSEFLTRANSWGVYGDFRLDFHSGQITYEWDMPIDENTDADLPLRCGLAFPTDTIYHYHRGIAAVLEGRLTPKEVIEMCEKAAL